MDKQKLVELADGWINGLKGENNYAECCENALLIKQELQSFPNEKIKSKKIKKICEKGFVSTRLDEKRDLANDLQIILLELRLEASELKNEALQLRLEEDDKINEQNKKIIKSRIEKNKKYSKKGVWFWIIMAIIGCLGAAVVVWAITDIIKKGWDTFNVLAIFDVTIGCVGFIIERILDHNNSKMNIETDDAISSDNPETRNVIINKYEIFSGNKIKIKGNVEIGNSTTNNYHK